MGQDSAPTLPLGPHSHLDAIFCQRGVRVISQLSPRSADQPRAALLEVSGTRDGEKAGDVAVQWVYPESWVSGRTQPCWHSLITSVTYPSCCALLFQISSSWSALHGMDFTPGMWKQPGGNEFCLRGLGCFLPICPSSFSAPLKSRHWCATGCVWDFLKAKGLLQCRGIHMQSWPLFTETVSQWQVGSDMFLSN